MLKSDISTIQDPKVSDLLLLDDQALEPGGDPSEPTLSPQDSIVITGPGISTKGFPDAGISDEGVSGIGGTSGRSSIHYFLAGV